MKQYQTVALFKPDATDSYISSLSKKLEKIMGSKPGKLIKKDDWGVQRLAYEIKKQNQGRYISWHFTQLPKALGEIDHKLRYEEDVIRFMTVMQETKSEKDKKPRKGKKSSPNVEEGQKKGEGRAGQRLNRTEVRFNNIPLLSKFITDRGKIVPRRVSGVDATSQRAIAVAIKQARQMGLLSYTEGFGYSGSSEDEQWGGRL